MFGRTEFYAFEMSRKRKANDNLLSWLPRDVAHYISTVCYAPNSDTATLLHLIAYGDLPNVKVMLEVNPKLVLDAGDVTTPSGLKMKRITPLELALSGAHPDIAKLVDSAFSKINGSEEQKISYQKLKDLQYERYRPHIEKMLNQKPYDFTNLFEAIRENDFEQELEKFREYIKRGAQATKTVGMQFNYNDVLEFFKFYEALYGILSYDQRDTASRLVYGLIMRNFPAYNRQVSARGLYDVLEKREPQMDWTFNLNGQWEPAASFPITAGDDSHTGLGFDYYIKMNGALSETCCNDSEGREAWQDCFEQQRQLLLNLCRQDQSLSPEKQSRSSA